MNTAKRQKFSFSCFSRFVLVISYCTASGSISKQNILSPSIQWTNKCN